MSLGVEPVISRGTSIDGIDELLDNLPHSRYFAPNVENLRGAGESIHLHCTDEPSPDDDDAAPGEWMIHLAPEGFGWEHHHGKGTVAVRAPSTDLLLLVYGRRPLADQRYTVFGEGSVMDSWLLNSAI